MSGTAIASAAAYVPRGYVERSRLAEAWGVPAQPGRRSVAGADEDSLTLAVEAGFRALAAANGPPIGLVVFASTNLPYPDKQHAGLVAAALDLPETVRTLDLTGSPRCAVDAVAVAADAVAAGSVEAALVVAGERQEPRPGSAAEQSAGDGGAAVLVTGTGGLATFEAWASRHRNEPARWEKRVAGRELKPALAVAGATAVPGRGPEREVGDWGAAAPLLGLVSALEAAAAGDEVVFGAAGDGASAARLRRGPAQSAAEDVAGQLTGRREVTAYGPLAVPAGEPDSSEVSPVAAWRREAQLLGRRCGLCSECGTRQYPAAASCVRCGARGTQSLVPMAGRGRVFTFTLDHLVNGVYQQTPEAKCVLDLEDGTRYYAVMTDADPSAVEIGMPVELAFRLRSRGGGYRNYGWKCRPV